jgi:hypothetical protein
MVSLKNDLDVLVKFGVEAELEEVSAWYGLTRLKPDAKF